MSDKKRRLKKKKKKKEDGNDDTGHPETEDLALGKKEETELPTKDKGFILNKDEARKFFNDWIVKNPDLMDYNPVKMATDSYLFVNNIWDPEAEKVVAEYYCQLAQEWKIYDEQRLQKAMH